MEVVINVVLDALHDAVLDTVLDTILDQTLSWCEPRFGPVHIIYRARSHRLA